MRTSLHYLCHNKEIILNLMQYALEQHGTRLAALLRGETMRISGKLFSVDTQGDSVIRFYSKCKAGSKA